MNKSMEDHSAFIDKVIRRMWIGAMAIIAGVVLYLFFLSLSGLPSFDELENPNYDFASQIISEDNQILGRAYIENRVPVTYDQLSKHVINALIATEDSRFYTHSGVDYKAVLRVVAKTILLGNSESGGGSTITQQLAKLLYSDRDFRGMGKLRRTIALINIKLKEWLTSIKLERSYTKEEIISMYLNKFNFIYGAYGIQAASEIYFNTTASALDPSQAAVLVGMLKNPSLYNPVRRMEQANQRRTTVINRQVEQKFLTRAQADEILSKPIELHFTPKSHIEGIATYFRMEVIKDVQNIIRNNDIQRSDGSLYDVYRDGLKIYTTINAQMQQIAETTMLGHMKNVQSKLISEWKGKDPWKYEADAYQLSIRESSMKNLVRNSDRYRTMRSSIFEPELEPLAREFPDLAFTDIEFDIMADLKQQGIEKTIKKYKISKDQISKYSKVITKDSYQDVHKKWMAFRDEVRKAFAKKVKMKVFAYNQSLEKDTTMTPYDSIRYHRFFLQTGIVAIEPSTGHVKVWVGGINHKYFKFDHVRSKRQVGSTFKPFVYASAIAFQGVSPCQRVVDQQYVIAPGDGHFGLLKPWVPGNAEGKFSGKSMTLFEALKESRNSVSVYLMKQLGSTSFVRGLASNLGIDSTLIPAQPSICLGAADLTCFEMTGAYNAFANNGTYVSPTYISKIEDKNGKVLYKSVNDERLALAPNYNRAVVELLAYAVKGSPGFGEIKSEIGGKTGTTNDYVDGWFMGITPSLVVGTWVGGDDRWIRFLSLANGQGSKMARPFFSEFIRRLEQDPNTGFDYKSRFMMAPSDGKIITDCSQYQRPSVISPKEDTSGGKPGKIKGEDDFFE